MFAHYKVHSVKVISEKMKFDGAVVKLAECVIGDDTGSSKFLARDAQLDVITEGETITLMNAHAKIIHGFMRLEVDKWGIVKPAAEADKLTCEVNTENNLSEVEYELVPNKHDAAKGG